MGSRRCYCSANNRKSSKEQRQKNLVSNETTDNRARDRTKRVEGRRRKAKGGTAEQAPENWSNTQPTEGKIESEKIIQSKKSAIQMENFDLIPL